MARKEQVTCDVCGAQKQETNHWFVVLTHSNRTDFIVDSDYDPYSAYWQYDTDYKVTDLCGEACVLKKVSELISK
jgi:hypothetical protein